MRVTTAFNRLLRLPGASVVDVCFGGEGVIVTVRLRRRRRVCSLVRPDRRAAGDSRPAPQALAPPRSRRQPLHHRVRAAPAALPGLRQVRLEPVPWARPDSPYTRDFEDVVAWLAQQMAKTPIAGLLRIGWDTVGRIVAARHGRPPRRRAASVGLVAIGVDEISYRRGQRYLTSVADHATGAIVWCAPGRNSATLQAFFDELGERRHSIRAVSIDMSGEYQRAIRAGDPAGRDLLRPLPRLPARQPRDRPGPPRRVERPRALAHRDGPLGQGHPLVAAQGARAPDRRPARHPRRGPAGQHPALPRLPAARRAQAALPPRRPGASRRRTSTPGWPGQPDPGSTRSSRSPAPSAPTATASSPPSASASPTAASKASTARSASSATAASASTPPPPSSPSSTSAAAGIVIELPR